MSQKHLPWPSRLAISHYLSKCLFCRFHFLQTWNSDFATAQAIYDNMIFSFNTVIKEEQNELNHVCCCVRKWAWNLLQVCTYAMCCRTNRLMTRLCNSTLEMTLFVINMMINIKMVMTMTVLSSISFRVFYCFPWPSFSFQAFSWFCRCISSWCPSFSQGTSGHVISCLYPRNVIHDSRWMKHWCFSLTVMMPFVREVSSFTTNTCT